MYLVRKYRSRGMRAAQAWWANLGMVVVHLAAALHRAATDAAMRARARQLGEAIRCEDGIGRALELIRARRVKVADIITHRLALSETVRGFELVAHARDSIKVVIEPQR